MTQENDAKILEQEFARYNELQARSYLSIDNIIAQLSVGVVIVLATLGKEILGQSKFFSFITIILLGVTILLIIVGYFLSDFMFRAVKNKLNENYKNNISLFIGLSDIWQGRVVNWINKIQIITFALAFISLFVLLFMYIGKIK